VIADRLEPTGMSLDELDVYYGPQYRQRLY
jgi:hypothetical protein